MIKRISVITSTMALAAATLSGCSLQTQTSSEPTASTESEIIGGVATNDPKYQAVGAIYVEIPYYGFFEMICSATLVGPQAILTARHCTPVIELAMYLGGTSYMVFGANAFAPDQMVPIVDFVNAPPSPNHPGLLGDGGRDMAVAHLASAPEGITPAKLGRFDRNDLHEKFQLVGYGASNADFFVGEKFVGKAKATADRGRWYRLLFEGSKQRFENWYFTDAATNPTQAEADAWWDGFPLEPKYEVVLEGKSVACFGDSGGPMLQGTNASNMTTYGVSFAVEGSIANLCDHGSGYAVLNKEMLDFVKANL
jgi:hypothetical protein